MAASKYMLTKLEGEEHKRLPGDLEGKDFLIDSLKNCTVYILDHTAQIQVSYAARGSGVLDPAPCLGLTQAPRGPRPNAAPVTAATAIGGRRDARTKNS